MNKKIIIAVLTASAMLLSGCKKEEKDGGITEATTTVTEVTTEKVPEETTAETEATTAETTVETTVTETEPEIETKVETEAVTTENKSDEGNNFNKASDWNYISNSKSGDGFITNDPQNITDSILDVGMKEVELSKETMLNNADDDKVVYRLKIQNAASAGEVNGMFMTTVVRDDGFYFLAFGESDNSTLEDVLPYCSKDYEVEYWAFGEMTDEGIPVLVPFVAGSEESGYYLIIPALKQMGQDVGEMTVPSFNVGTAVNAAETTTATSSKKDDNLQSYENTDGSVYLNITNIKNGDVITTAECELANNTGRNIFLTGSKLIVNGADYSDKFTAFIEIGSGKTITDEIFIDDIQLYAGDKLEIYFTVGDSDTYDDLGKIKFNMELEVIG